MTRLHINTPAGYVVASLVLIGFGLGLMITPVSNMIMNSVTKTKQGMISSLTSLERFVPLTLGIAAFNLIFIQGVLAIASGHSVLTTSPADIKMQVLAAGFDLAFLLSLVLGIVILVLAFVVSEEVHPDYRTGSDDIEPPIGML